MRFRVFGRDERIDSQLIDAMLEEPFKIKAIQRPMSLRMGCVRGDATAASGRFNETPDCASSSHRATVSGP
jgi:hypothetical protein